MVQGKDTSSGLRAILGDMKFPTKRAIMQIFLDSKVKDMLLSVLDNVEIDVHTTIRLRTKKSAHSVKSKSR